jgi:tetratricopeptide (TPR) repeat protein/predicted aspartyl protease
MAMGIFTMTCFSSPSFGADQCEARPVAELPITIKNHRATIVAKINGREARFLIDSGAFYSTMTAATAAEFGLTTFPAPWGFRITGIGGSQSADITRVKEFTLIDVPFKNLEFLVGGSEVGSEAVGLLGQNFLELFDVEYDLAQGVIRLFRTKNCGHSRLAYWLTADQQYSVMDIEPLTREHPFTMGVAYLNGQKIKLAFDSGASNSVLSAQAAERAGVKLNSEGVQPAGYLRGIGRGMVKNYIARFSSFKVGDGEEIKNAKLRIVATDLRFTDMLLGADFFLSHRIFVGNKEHRLFLSYSGGPVFDLSGHTETPLSAQNDSAPTGGDVSQLQTAGATDGDAKNVEAQQLDASEAARQGAALVSRGEFNAGIALLSKAVTLNPAEPDYYYQRGNAYWAGKQPDLALKDFDQALKLKPGFLSAYIPRAELDLNKGNTPAALADLEAVDRLAPKQADLRYTLAALYERMDHLPESIQQYGAWIESHPDDARMVAALAGRCYSRALANLELPGAMKDCDKALSRADKSNPNNAQLHVDRALVYIRLGEFDKAISDCSDALKQSPKNASALYVKAVAELRKDKKAESSADLALARQIAPKIGQRLERYGFTI